MARKMPAPVNWSMATTGADDLFDALYQEIGETEEDKRPQNGQVVLNNSGPYRGVEEIPHDEHACNTDRHFQDGIQELVAGHCFPRHQEIVCL
jgi:hypothetical protein